MNIYLYIKTHQKTGLKYLGMTTKVDPHKYVGSGKMWKCHLKEHGYNYTTEILCKSTSKEEIKQKGKYYSKLWNIVKSDKWANLKVESGDGGWTPAPGRSPWNKGIQMTSEQKNKISKTKKGKYSGVNNGFYGKHHSTEVKEIISNSKKGIVFDPDVVAARNKKQTGVSKPTVSAKLKGKPKSEEHKEKIRQAWAKRLQS